LLDFADTCVFAKQSLGPILCDPLRLRPQLGFTYQGLPFFRSYGDNLPSSFSTSHSSTLGFSPRLRVSVSGTVTRCTPRRGFSRQSAPTDSAGSEEPASASALGYPGLFSPGTAYHVTPGRPSPGPAFAPASPLRVMTHIQWFRNVHLIPIVYALRPRLRDRLTRGG
jgi:hypothetical protein